MQSARAHDDDLTDSPIDPSWVVDGHPRARSRRWHTSSDSAVEFYIWDCSAGTFDWTFYSEEAVHIVAGEVRIGDPQTGIWLRPGDSAVFAAGTTHRWHVPDYVRKHATLRTPLPTALIRVGRFATRVGRRLATAIGHATH
ncbi:MULTISPECIES: cupin domain-containing protein [unclassified Mycobacterium]|uniref:cupin domain-containing protein n=1 Tax=unclassified Mycobacterium TaxID=2642494 RepID=UPI00048CE9C1|nr:MULTISPECIES: cupin domain-containing protein [unclassified Mycobacterium]SEB14277.1 hypothetical protein SAMN04488580_10868 [Mycobacterium sp. 283mftsu]